MDNLHVSGKDDVNEQIMLCEKFVASILSQPKIHFGTQDSYITLTNLMGIVATLGYVKEGQ